MPRTAQHFRRLGILAGAFFFAKGLIWLGLMAAAAWGGVGWGTGNGW